MMEQVLVVPSALILPHLKGSFIRENTDELLNLIVNNYTFIDRTQAESDREYKQIIPYVVIKRSDEVLLLRRKKAQTEKRLHGLMSLGVGGHINPDSEASGNMIEHGLFRELNEEVKVDSILSLRFMGIINDDSSDVSNFHLGFCYELETEGNVEIVEKEKMEGGFVPASSIKEQRDAMETWSQVLLDNGVI